MKNSEIRLGKLELCLKDCISVINAIYWLVAAITSEDPSLLGTEVSLTSLLIYFNWQKYQALLVSHFFSLFLSLSLSLSLYLSFFSVPLFLFFFSTFLSFFSFLNWYSSHFHSSLFPLLSLSLVTFIIFFVSLSLYGTFSLISSVYLTLSFFFLFCLYLTFSLFMFPFHSRAKLTFFFLVFSKHHKQNIHCFFECVLLCSFIFSICVFQCQPTALLRASGSALGG